MGILGVLCLVAAPTFASPALYTFNVTQGSLVLNLQGQGSTQGTMGGTFAATIAASNGHIGASDTFILEDAGLVNTSAVKLGLAGLATANIGVGKARFMDFAPAAAGHIAGNGVPATVLTDVYVEATVVVTGLLNTTLITKVWANSLLPFNVAFNTSVSDSGVINATLSGAFGYAVGVTDISMTLTLDLIVNIQGTAHAVPDPALGGLTALGLGGAGAWLRRRRS
jgi:hypothetical protein